MPAKRHPGRSDPGPQTLVTSEQDLSQSERLLSEEQSYEHGARLTYEQQIWKEAYERYSSVFLSPSTEDAMPFFSAAFRLKDGRRLTENLLVVPWEDVTLCVLHRIPAGAWKDPWGGVNPTWRLNFVEIPALPGFLPELSPWLEGMELAFSLRLARSAGRVAELTAVDMFRPPLKSQYEFDAIWHDPANPASPNPFIAPFPAARLRVITNKTHVTFFLDKVPAFRILAEDAHKVRPCRRKGGERVHRTIEAGEPFFLAKEPLVVGRLRRGSGPRGFVSRKVPYGVICADENRKRRLRLAVELMVRTADAAFGVDNPNDNRITPAPLAAWGPDYLVKVLPETLMAMQKFPDLLLKSFQFQTDLALAMDPASVLLDSDSQPYVSQYSSVRDYRSACFQRVQQEVAPKRLQDAAKRFLWQTAQGATVGQSAATEPETLIPADYLSCFPPDLVGKVLGFYVDFRRAARRGCLNSDTGAIVGPASPHPVWTDWLHDCVGCSVDFSPVCF